MWRWDKMFTAVILIVGDLAREYEFADVDGSQPPAFRMPERRD